MIIAQALCLSEALIDSDSARLDTEILLAYAINKTRTYLFTWPEQALTQAQETEFRKLMARRASGEPIAYITQCREFWSLSLMVGPSTLIPRGDTEVLVEEALKRHNQAPFASILDLGTGTGAIALALATECPSAQVHGVDSNSEAILLAETNRSNLNIGNAKFYQSNWFSSVTQRFDLIVSNPPYIDPCDKHLQEGDVRFEPSSALVADNHGLADLEHIISNSPAHLNKGGWLMVEHGREQGELVRQLLVSQSFSDIFTQRDYSDNDRISGGCWRL